jgi:hypothetical protein
MCRSARCRAPQRPDAPQSRSIEEVADAFKRVGLEHLVEGRMRKAHGIRRCRVVKSSDWLSRMIGRVFQRWRRLSHVGNSQYDAVHLAYGARSPSRSKNAPCKGSKRTSKGVQAWARWLRQWELAHAPNLSTGPTCPDSAWHALFSVTACEGSRL